MVARLFTQAAPAAGTDFVFVLPGGYMWELLSVNATLTCSPTDALRTPNLVIGDGTSEIVSLPPFTSQSANEVLLYSWVAGVAYQYGDLTRALQTSGLPAPLYLPMGYRVFTRTVDIQPDDQWGTVTVWVDDGAPDPLFAIVEPPRAPAPQIVFLP